MILALPTPLERKISDRPPSSDLEGITTENDINRGALGLHETNKKDYSNIGARPRGHKFESVTSVANQQRPHSSASLNCRSQTESARSQSAEPPIRRYPIIPQINIVRGGGRRGDNETDELSDRPECEDNKENERLSRSRFRNVTVEREKPIETTLKK